VHSRSRPLADSPIQLVRPAHRKFADVDWWRAPTSGSPLLTDALAWFDCVVERNVPAGDHIVFLGRVIDFG
jgi:flavin reductase (DIM6/NTAB) family NADH-FMN oxidoreductase RutF